MRVDLREFKWLPYIAVAAIVALFVMAGVATVLYRNNAQDERYQLCREVNELRTEIRDVLRDEYQAPPRIVAHFEPVNCEMFRQ